MIDPASASEETATARTKLNELLKKNGLTRHPKIKAELIPALAGLEDSPWGEWTALDGTATPHMLTQGDIGRLLRPSPSDRRRSGRRDDARERNQRADIPVSNSRRHGPPIANQAPHRHRQANSGTCRGREPPHARHTFEVLPPETGPVRSFDQTLYDRGFNCPMHDPGLGRFGARAWQVEETQAQMCQTRTPIAKRGNSGWVPAA